MLEHKVLFNKPKEPVAGAVIILHGLGADYNDFMPIVDQLKLDKSLKFIFPNANVIPVTINNGFRMRAWYDILNISDIGRDVDNQGIKQSIIEINKIIDSLVTEALDYKDITIAGFSQGGVISYYTLLNHTQKLRAGVSLSTYLPSLNLITNDKNNTTPIFVAHGKQDNVVAFKFGKSSFDLVKNINSNAIWHEYNMDHSVCIEELNDLSDFLNKVYS